MLFKGNSAVFILFVLINLVSAKLVDGVPSVDLDEINHKDDEIISNVRESDIYSEKPDMPTDPVLEVEDKEVVQDEVVLKSADEEVQGGTIEFDDRKLAESEEYLENKNVEEENMEINIENDVIHSPYQRFRDVLKRLRMFPLSLFSTSEQKSPGSKETEAHTVFLADGSPYQTGEGQGKDKNTKDGKSTKVNCKHREYTEDAASTNKVITVNDTSLQTLLKNGRDSADDDDSVDSLSPAVCQLLLLYAPWCRFSVEFSPHYTALARVYPHLELMAINAVTLNYWNARFGTVAVPNVLLFHHGKFIAKFNSSEKNLESLNWFIQNHTNLDYNGSVSLVPTDFDGDLPVIVEPSIDIYLYISWLVIIIAICRTLKLHTKCCNAYTRFLRPDFTAHPHLD